MSTTPTTPQWAIEAAKEYFGHWTGNCEDPAKSSMERMSAIIAKHAPPLSPPTDEAGLREVIGKVLGVNRYLAGYPQARATLADKLLTALAPHLSQREPGDSELLVSWDSPSRDTTVLISRVTTKGMTVIYEGRGRDGMWRESHDKSAQRGEGKPL